MVSTLPTIGSARMPGQTWMTGVSISEMVRRCWAIISARWSLSAVNCSRLRISVKSSLRILMCQGQGHPHGRALPRGAANLHATLVRLHELLHQREPQTEPFGSHIAGLWGPEEL